MILSPSLLAANASNYYADIDRIEKAGADWLHIDVMDGHFVPNLSFGSNVVSDLRPFSHLFFDVHLMIEDPLVYMESFIDAGADGVTIHPEANCNLNEAARMCRTRGVSFGLAIKPDTPLSQVSHFLGECDILLVMAIQPGFGGQAFLPETLPRIKEATYMRELFKFDYKIGVDGGINLLTGADCLANGADILVAGSAVFSNENPTAMIKRFKEL